MSHLWKRKHVMWKAAQELSGSPAEQEGEGGGFVGTGAPPLAIVDSEGYVWQRTTLRPVWPAEQADNDTQGVGGSRTEGTGEQVEKCPKCGCAKLTDISPSSKCCYDCAYVWPVEWPESCPHFTNQVGYQDESMRCNASKKYRHCIVQIGEECPHGQVAPSQPVDQWNGCPSCGGKGYHEWHDGTKLNREICSCRAAPPEQREQKKCNHCGALFIDEHACYGTLHDDIRTLEARCDRYAGALRKIRDYVEDAEDEWVDIVDSLTTLARTALQSEGVE